MDNRLAIRTMLCLLVLPTATAYANEEQALELEFLEFLAEGRQLDGEYYDPVLMQGWEEQKEAETDLQQEGNDHE